MQPYVFKEYPKWVVDTTGKRLIVQNREEEDKVTGTDKPVEKLANNEKPLPKNPRQKEPSGW